MTTVLYPQLQKARSLSRGLSGNVFDAETIYSEQTHEIRCPGKAAARRIRKFDKAIGSSSTPEDANIVQLSPEDVLMKGLLGQGGFSTVYEVFLRDSEGRFSGSPYAMKQLKPWTASETMAASDLALETKILFNLNHENIIALHGIRKGDMIESIREGTFFLVLDMLVETLDTRLDRWKQNKKSIFSAACGKVTITQRLREAALGISQGMQYLHSQNLMFRDLKPQNIGFDTKGTVKIFDFGLAREYSQDAHGHNAVKPRLMTGETGTPRYMAPEVATLSRTYSFPADVYSFSILLWQIITNRIPFGNITCPKIFKQKVVLGNRRPKLKFVESEPLKHLMEASWSSDPNMRPTFVTITRNLHKIVRLRPSFCGLQHAKQRLDSNGTTTSKGQLTNVKSKSTMFHRVRRRTWRKAFLPNKSIAKLDGTASIDQSNASKNSSQALLDTESKPEAPNQSDQLTTDSSRTREPSIYKTMAATTEPVFVKRSRSYHPQPQMEPDMMERSRRCSMEQDRS